MAAFSRLLPALTSAYALQTALAAVFVPQANEMFYDLGGALGFLSTTFVSLYYPALRLRYLHGTPLPPITSFAPRQLLMSGMIGIWSARLGSFLLMRAQKAGGDSRFDEVKHQPAKFTAFWMAQATWVFLIGLPVYLVNAIPPSANPTLRMLDYTGIAVYALGLGFEVIADRQKSEWRKKRDLPYDKGGHGEKFISNGLWGISRHPNYVGEVAIQTGMFITSINAVRGTPFFPQGFWAAAAVSPLFTWFLLRKVSGVPPLEEAGDKKFKDDPKWKEYKSRVPVFWPWGSTKA